MSSVGVWGDTHMARAPGSRHLWTVLSVLTSTEDHLPGGVEVSTHPHDSPLLLPHPLGLEGGVWSLQGGEPPWLVAGADAGRLAVLQDSCSTVPGSGDREAGLPEVCVCSVTPRLQIRALSP